MAPALSWEVTVPTLGQTERIFFSGCLSVFEQQAGPGHCACGGAGQGGPVATASPSRGQQHVAEPHGTALLPSGWCMPPAGFAGVRAGGGLSWCPGPLRTLPKGPAFGWGLAHRYPHHPWICSPPQMGGTSRSVGLVSGAVSASRLPPPQALLSCAHSPPGFPSFPGGHLCPQPLRRRAAFGHCLHPNPMAQCHPVPPRVPEPPPAPSLPSPASLGMAPRALRPGSVSGQRGSAGPLGAGHWVPGAPTAPLKIGQ